MSAGWGDASDRSRRRRLCDEPDLVAKLWADGPMTPAEQEELEDCYQRGILPCDDVAENDCTFEQGCNPSWGCGVPGLYFHCGDGSTTKACTFHGDGRTCNGGVVAERKVLIPRNFPTGNTVLTWRWDSHDTTEVFAACADITITPAENTPTHTPTVAPTPKPTVSKEPTVDAPVPEPTAEGAGYCCWWGPNEPDRCNPCTSQAGPTEWCGVSQERCEGCGNGVWCVNGGPAPAPDPTAAPDPTPSPTPAPKPTPGPSETRIGYSGGGDYCCFEGGCTSSCYAPVFPEYYCGQTETACYACGGIWCYDMV